MRVEQSPLSDDPEDTIEHATMPLGTADDYTYQRLPFIVPPTAPWRAKWDMVIVVALLYTATVTVFEVAFLPVAINAIFIINRFVDVAFISDLVLTFMTPYVDRDTQLWVVRHGRIAAHYMFSRPYWFWIDAVTCVPFDAIAFALESSDSSNLHALRLLRLLRLIRVLRILRGLTIVKRYEVESGLKNSTKTLIFFAFLILIMAHWASCLFVLTVQLEGRTTDEYQAQTELNNGTSPNPDSWNWILGYFEYSLGLAGKGSQDETGVTNSAFGLWSVYLAGYYYAIMTLTTIGYGDVVPKTDAERGYTIMIMFLGGAIYAYAVGSLCAIVANSNPLRTEFKNDMDDLSDYMVACKLPKDIRQRIRRYMHFAFEKRRTELHRSLIDELSPGLTEEVADFLNRKWVAKVPFLRPEIVPDFDDIVKSLVTKLRLQAHAPLEIMLRPGLQVEEMCIVDRGGVLIHEMPDPYAKTPAKQFGQLYVDETLPPAVVTELSNGCCFGHECIIDEEFWSPYYATTLTFSNIYHISKEDAKEVVALFPRSKEMLQAYGKRMGYAVYSRPAVVSPTLVKGAHQQIEQEELAALKGELAMLLTKIKIKNEELRAAMGELQDSNLTSRGQVF